MHKGESPKEPTAFAKMLGLKRLGRFNKDTLTYTAVISPPPDAINFFSTIHGGYLSALFDDAFGMLAYFIYGVNSAATSRISINFIKALKPSRSIPLVVEVSFKELEGLELKMGGRITRGNYLIATAESIWSLRKKFLA